MRKRFFTKASKVGILQHLIFCLLNLNISACRNIGENQLIGIVKRNLIKTFKRLSYSGIILMENLIHIQLKLEYTHNIDLLQEKKVFADFVI